MDVKQFISYEQMKSPFATEAALTSKEFLVHQQCSLIWDKLYPEVMIKKGWGQRRCDAREEPFMSCHHALEIFSWKIHRSHKHESLETIVEHCTMLTSSKKLISHNSSLLILEHV